MIKVNASQLGVFKFSKSYQKIKYFFYNGFLKLDDVIILSLKGRSELFFVEIRILRVKFDFSFFILFAFKHFKVKFILVFKFCFLFKEFEFISFFVVVFSSLFVIFFLLKKSKMLSAFDLTSFTIFSFWDSVFES